MKNKILFALAVLVLAFSLVGCEPSASQFYGKWVLDGYLSTHTYEIKADGTYTFTEEYSGLGARTTIYQGTWVWNGDDTATFTDEFYADEYDVLHGSDYKNENDESRTGYLLIKNEKYWKVKKESNSEE